MTRLGLLAPLGGMKLFGKWRILIEGDERTLEVEPWHRTGLDYLLNRLFSGEDVAPEALEYYHITVRPLGEDDEIISVPPEAQ